MGFKALILSIVAIAIAIAQVSAGSHDDGNSVARLATDIRQNFQELFQRLDRLELKVNGIIENGNDQTRDVASGAGVVDGVSHEGSNDNLQPRITPRSNESQLEVHVKEVHRLQKILSQIVTVPACQKQAAHIPQPVVVATINSSQNFSCQSNGQPLSSCIWGRNVNGTREAIIVDQQVTENDGNITTDGVAYSGQSGDLEAGKCTISIESVTESHFGLWSCTLVSKNSTIFNGAVHVAPALGNGKDDEEKQLRKTGVTCENKQIEFLMILKQVFDDGHNCAPCPECDVTAKGKLHDVEVKLQRKQRTLEDLMAAFMAPPTKARSARVSNSTVPAKMKTTINFACESHDGQPWGSCFWEQKDQGQRILVIVDEEVARSGEQSLVDGIAYVGDIQNNNGTCELKIESMTERYYGQWSCTLVSQNGKISRGELKILDVPELKQQIYFGTSERGVSAYSLETTETKKILNSSDEDLYGITFDSMRRKLYWCSTTGNIYRGNTNGSEVQTVLRYHTHAPILGLAFDWVAGNIYASTNGFILACDAGATRTFTCFTILDGQSWAQGITLNPNEGTMYWTRFTTGGSIHRAGMDGSGPTTILTGLNYPTGVIIDFANQRLYWTSYSINQIQSSDLDGQGVRTVVQLPRGSYPFGIALSTDRIYWGDHGNNKLQSCTKDGRDIQTLYTETKNVFHITIVPALDHRTNRTNPCEGRNCSKLCVLTPASYRCLS